MAESPADPDPAAAARPRLRAVPDGGEDTGGQLLVRHRDGDPDAFRALVAAYRAPVYGYLGRCGVDGIERDDLFQEVFVRIHRAAGSYQAGRPAHPWIFTIVSNAVRNHLRRRRVRQLVEGDPPAVEPADAAPDGERRATARQALRRLERELGRLRLVEREVVLLAGVEQLALKDVARVLSLPLGTVKTHLRRARLRLARALGPTLEVTR